MLTLFRPGINDDGSGTVGVLTVAEALSKYKVKNAVRLGFWGAEEVSNSENNPVPNVH